MVPIERRRSREESTRMAVRSFVFGKNRLDLGLSCLMETNYQIFCKGTEIMAFSEREGVINLYVPYEELPQEIKSFVDRLKNLGYS